MMPKSTRDFITPETSRRVKGMSLSALSAYLWKLYAAGYSAGFRDGQAAAREEPVPGSGTDKQE